MLHAQDHCTLLYVTYTGHLHHIKMCCTLHTLNQWWNYLGHKGRTQTYGRVAGCSCKGPQDQWEGPQAWQEGPQDQNNVIYLIWETTMEAVNHCSGMCYYSEHPDLSDPVLSSCPTAH